MAGLVLSLSPLLAFASTPYEQCLLKQAMEADGQTTMGEIRRFVACLQRLSRQQSLLMTLIWPGRLRKVL